MRKGIAFLGIFLVILGFIGLAAGVIAYLNYNYLLYTRGLCMVCLQERNYFILAIGGIIGGGVLEIIGIILAIVGFKAESKKEVSAGSGKQ
ncbi:MAG: hypothetical protein M1306_00620 [Candidatus Thermoplasmatota archaeon]|nr:hypothetical protein [Candidatus Thermoplasmatota archaeon]